MIYTCGIYFIDNKKRVLIAHVTNQPIDGHTWTIPKGISDPGESYDVAACREFMEEAGIHITPTDLLPLGGFEYYSTYTGHKKTLVSFVHYSETTGDALNCKCDSLFKDTDGMMKPEVDEFRWVDHDTAKTMLHKSQLERLDSAFTLLKNLKNW